MNILVTGANGQLGNEMRIISKETSYNFLFTDVVEAEGVETTLLDITDAEAVEKNGTGTAYQLYSELCGLHQCRQG